MQTDGTRWVRAMFLFSLVLGVIPGAMVAQERVPADSRGSYYHQAYDQGFRAGQADYRAGRPYSYHAALVTTAGVAGISRDYRNAFRVGYQDGYAGHNNRGSDWYYRHHRHDSDCDEDDDRGKDNKDKWICRERHDNGKHKGWYKHHHSKQQGEDQDEDEDDD